MEAVRFIVWSDYLCPWCYNASRRLRRLEQEYRGQIELVWRSYLLRPNPTARTPERREKFVAYTRGWERVGADPDAAEFRPWAGSEGPPTHSVPAHVVAKAAQAVGPDAFQAMHERLLRAYFFESRDISDRDVLSELWSDAGLPDGGFPQLADPAFVDQVLDEYNHAFETGVTGVPAVQLEGNDAVIVGAHPEGLYRTWIDRTLARRSAGDDA